jgi:hypothetical protein
MSMSLRTSFKHQVRYSLAVWQPDSLTLHYFHTLSINNRERIIQPLALLSLTHVGMSPMLRLAALAIPLLLLPPLFEP